jgi:hypothetical protein
MARLPLGAYPSCSQARDNDVLFRTGQGCQTEETLSVCPKKYTKTDTEGENRGRQ